MTRSGLVAGGCQFDLRWYHKAGTMHFFPRRKDLVDRLNRMVGQRRGWLPPAGERVSDAFWLQYEQAERLDPEIRAEAESAAKAHASATGRYYSSWHNPIDTLMRGHTEDRDRANAQVLHAIESVLVRHGMLDALEDQSTGLLALAGPAPQGCATQAALERLPAANEPGRQARAA